MSEEIGRPTPEFQPKGQPPQARKANGAEPLEPVQEQVFANTKAATVEAAAGDDAPPETEPKADARIAELEAALALDDDEGVSNAHPQSLIVAVGKPPDFFMVHPDPRMSQIVSGVFSPGMSKSFYLVNADMRSYLTDYMKRVRLVLCVDMNDDEFLWPIKLPKMPGDEVNDWTRSADEAVLKARLEWRKLLYVEGVNGYKAEPRPGTAAPLAPMWSGRSWAEIRNQALADFVITDIKHPVAKRLREGKSRRGG
jgi:hypothetical protein